MGEREWITRVKSVLKNLVDIEYERVTSQALWGIRLIILVKPEHIKKISHVEHSQVCFLLLSHLLLYLLLFHLLLYLLLYLLLSIL